MNLTAAQKDKLVRLRKLNLIGDDENIINSPRRALVIAYKYNIITSWSDNGQFYTLEFPKTKTKRLRTYEVGEFIADKLLSMKDPLNETATEEPPKENIEEEAKDNPEEEIISEVEGVSGVGEAMVNALSTDYEELTVPELKDLCKELGITGYSTMRRDELIEALLTQNSI